MVDPAPGEDHPVGRVEVDELAPGGNAVGHLQTEGSPGTGIMARSHSLPSRPLLGVGQVRVDLGGRCRHEPLSGTSPARTSTRGVSSNRQSLAFGPSRTCRSARSRLWGVMAHNN